MKIEQNAVKIVEQLLNALPDKITELRNMEKFTVIKIVLYFFAGRVGKTEKRQDFNSNLRETFILIRALNNFVFKR